MKNYQRNFYSTLVLSLIIAAAAGCGSSSETSDGAVRTDGNNLTNSDPFGNNDSWSCPGGCSNATPTPTPEPFSSDAYAYDFRLEGPNGTQSFPDGDQGIPTNAHLRVRVTAVDAGPLSKEGYTAYSFPYGCAKFKVSANGQSKWVTLKLGNGLDSLCKNAKTSEIITFSVVNRGANPAPLKVTVSNPYYDWRCRWQWTQYCPLAPLHATHNIQGLVEIETDDTALGTN